MFRMPTAARLLGLYPPAWRARYGEEFLAMCGEEPLGVRQVFDLVMAAIDSWLSADVRHATRARGVAEGGGGRTMLRSMFLCGRERSRITERDGLVGAIVMLASTALLIILGIVARRSGWVVTGEILQGLAFPGSLLISMPFWMMKAQPWRAQAVIIGGALLFLVGIGWLATQI